MVDYHTEGNFPCYGNDDDRVDDIAATIVHTVMAKIKEIELYRDAIPTQSVLTITSNVVYGAAGAFPRDMRPELPSLPEPTRKMGRIPTECWPQCFRLESWITMTLWMVSL